MIENENIINAVEAYYRQKSADRNASEFFAEQKLKSHDDYNEARREYAKAVIARQKAVFDGDEQLAEKLSSEAQKLKTRLDKLIKYYSEAGDNFKPDCKICSDRGEINGKRCHCYYERMTREALRFLNVEPRRLYRFKDDKLSAANGMTAVFEKFKRYADGFSSASPSLFFTGQVGTGKTFLASAIADRVSKKDVCVLFLTAVELNRAFTAHQIAPLQDKLTFFDILNTVDLLVIDDLGAEPFYNNVTTEYLLAVLSERDFRKKPTILTTNLLPEAFEERYGDRIYSRIKRYLNINITGKDLREVKKRTEIKKQ